MLSRLVPCFNGKALSIMKNLPSSFRKHVGTKSKDGVGCSFVRFHHHVDQIRLFNMKRNPVFVHTCWHHEENCNFTMMNRQYHTSMKNYETNKEEETEMEICVKNLELLEKKVSEIISKELSSSHHEDVKLTIQQAKKMIGSDVFTLVSMFSTVCRSQSEGENLPSLQFMKEYLRAIRLCLKCGLRGWIELNTTDEFLTYLIRERERLSEIDDETPTVPPFIVDIIRHEVVAGKDSKYAKAENIDEEEPDWFFNYLLNAFKTSPILTAYAENINICQFIQQYLADYVSMGMHVISNSDDMSPTETVKIEAEFFEAVFYWSYYICSINSFVIEENSLAHMKKICDQFEYWKTQNKNHKFRDLETGVTISLDSCMDVVRAVIALCESKPKEAEKYLLNAITIDPSNIHAQGLLARECYFVAHPEKLEKLAEIQTVISKLNSIIDSVRNRQLGGEVPDQELPRFSADTNIKASLLLHAASLVPKANKGHTELIKKSSSTFDLSDLYCKIPYNIVNAYNRIRVLYSLEKYEETLQAINEILHVKFKLTEDQLRDIIIMLNLSLIQLNRAEESIKLIEPYIRGMPYDLELRYSWLFTHETLARQATTPHTKKQAISNCTNEYEKLLTALKHSASPQNLQAHISFIQGKLQQLNTEWNGNK
ncbi:hypothetical protein C9374_005259 [Naegleria lovaniensis]|uniref:Uncharacterized protein n=1 Tax=Naegleria lovaniensis TaxID=51637 RepID=A0AA88GKM8_NAELO|nr:uncharacterized protein C9374_005259 [Naegleria lovaniensis]KAG2382679.1 hypothetical protein C9374_005259 [Naegleria lovaniensis]